MEKPSLKEQAKRLRKQLQESTIVPAKMESWTLAEEELRTVVDKHRSQLVLEEEILRHIRHGYRVTARSETSAQLVRPKKFSLFWFLVWVIFTLTLLWPIYIVYFLAKREQGIYLRVTPAGSIDRVRSGPLFSLIGWLFIVVTVPLLILIALRIAQWAIKIMVPGSL